MAVCFETGFQIERPLKSNRASQHKRIMIRFILLLAMLLSSLASPVQAAQQLVLGVLAYRPKPVMEQAWRPLAESLAGKTKGKAAISIGVTQPASVKG